MTISFDFILPRLATGGMMSDAADVETLVAAGITHVIDCVDDSYETSAGWFASHPALSCLLNPTADDGQTKAPDWFADSIDYGFMALSKPHGVLYTHCDQGMNRGPSTAFAVMLALGWDYNTALDLIHKARPITVGGVRYASDAANAVKVLGFE